MRVEEFHLCGICRDRIAKDHGYNNNNFFLLHLLTLQRLLFKVIINIENENIINQNFIVSLVKKEKLIKKENQARGRNCGV